LALKKANIPLVHPELNDYFEKTLNQRSPQVVRTLRRMGLARLHLKQCYRQIPCLIRRPLKVSWTWAHTKAITRLSVREAEQLLHQKEKTKSVAYELSKLYTLDAQEPLAIVQQLAPHLRANLVFPDGQGIRRSMVKGTVPLFYPAEDLKLPELHLPPEKEVHPEEKTIRSDVQLESKPFLASVRIHRYLRNE